MKKIFFIIISLSLFLFNKSFAATGEATEYTITMTHLEMCDNTSTDTSCNNPIVLGTGASSAIDIAGTATGMEKSSINTSWATGFGVNLLNTLISKFYE